MFLERIFLKNFWYFFQLFCWKNNFWKSFAPFSKFCFKKHFEKNSNHFLNFFWKNFGTFFWKVFFKIWTFFFENYSQNIFFLKTILRILWSFEIFLPEIYFLNKNLKLLGKCSKINISFEKNLKICWKLFWKSLLLKIFWKFVEIFSKYISVEKKIFETFVECFWKNWNFFAILLEIIFFEQFLNIFSEKTFFKKFQPFSKFCFKKILKNFKLFWNVFCKIFNPFLKIFFIIDFVKRILRNFWIVFEKNLIFEQKFWNL